MLGAPVLSRITPHAILGDSGDADLDWKLYGAAETGQVNVANRDKADGLKIIQSCERRDAATLARLNRPWWRIF